MWPLLLASSLALGGGDRPAPGGDGWSKLDDRAQDGALAAAESPFSWGVLIRTFFTQSEKEAGDGVSDADVSGFVFEDADLWLALDHEDFSARVSADLEQDGGVLEDAHATFRALDWLAVRMGQFKPRVVRSGSVPEDGLLFRERTFLGAAFDAWDDGVELGGHYDQFDWWVALTFGPYAFNVEWAQLDDAFAREIDVFNGYLVTVGDGHPFSATLSRRIGADVEAALRVQAADDVDETEAFGASAGWSPGGGAARFVADLELVEGETRDFSMLSLGVQVGSSGVGRPFADAR